MKISDISLFSGRNIYSHKPVIKMIVDIEDLHDKTTKDIPRFNDTLLSLFPTLEEHYCGVGYKGGFIDRLKEGTYFGHVLEHLTLELQSLLGYKVFFGKTRIKEEPSIYNVIFEYGNGNLAVECARKALFIIEKIIAHEDFDLKNIMDSLTKLKGSYELGPSTQAIYDEAKRRGIPVTRLGGESILMLGTGKYSRLIQAALTDTTSCISVDISCNKQLTKQLLEESDIPVPYGDIAYTPEDAANIAREIGFPVVLKPLNGNQGKGVVLNLQNEKDVREAFRIPLEHGPAVIVEKLIHGKDYRVLVIGDKVSAVSERTPPFIIGDGSHSIRELIDIENSNILRGEDHEKPLTKIKLDSVTLDYLRKNNLDESAVPDRNEMIQLRDNANLSTGGTAKECTKDIHPENAKIAVRTAKAIGLDIAGIDIKVADISKPIRNSQGAVIEVNAAPGLRMHLQPESGSKVNVAADIMDMMFPKGSTHSIPIISITGTNGKTTTTRLIKHTLSLSGKTVGMTTTSGVYVGDECVLKGDNTGPFSAKTVLKNKNVDIAVLEVARGGIVKRGLGYDLADVGIITNISEDHLGLDGVDTLEDLAFVKSLVVEAVKPNGHSVLNADDRMTEYFLKRAAGNIVLFSKNKNNPLIFDHVKNGGKALFVRDNTIIISDSSNEKSLIDVRDIPITFKGSLECNIENCLSAACSLYALGVPLDSIRKGLLSFKPDIEMNPGRFNIFDMGSFKVMLDYGHNLGGYEEVGKFVHKLDAKRIVGVIGVPGDRTNESIAKLGALCSKIFTKVYIKEDNDLRGRKPGEVAGLLNDALINSSFNPENIKIILPELEALQTAIFEAEKDDMIIMFYEEFEPAVKLANQMKPIAQKDKLVNISDIYNRNQLEPSGISNINNIPQENLDAIAEI